MANKTFLASTHLVLHRSCCTEKNRTISIFQLSSCPSCRQCLFLSGICIFSTAALPKPQTNIQPLYQTAILHCYFYWISWMNAFFIIIVLSFSNGHQGSLSGALLVYPATTQKALRPVRLKEGLCMWWAPHIMLHLPNWKANSIIHVTDRKATFHKLFLFEVLILFWFMKN